MNKDYNQNNSDSMNMPEMSSMPRDFEDYMYPEIYQKLSPVCDRLIRDMEKQYGHIYLNEDLLSQMSDEAIRRLGISGTSETEDSRKEKTDAIPTIRGFDRHDGYGRGRWRHYDRPALSDIAGILILNQIFGRRRPYCRWR